MIRSVRVRLFAYAVLAASIVVWSSSPAPGASNYDFRYATGIYKGPVNDCVTDATVALTKAGFSGVGSENHARNSSAYGSQSNYQGLVICTKTDSATVYTELVFGPAGSTLSKFFDTLDKNF